MTRIAGGFATASFLALFAFSASAAPAQTECMVGARPGGGFDITCQLVAEALLAAKLIDKPMTITYMPGELGGTLYDFVSLNRRGDPGAVVASSSGSLLLITQKKFGKGDEHAVRWLGAIGGDYGAVAVRIDSPYRNLKELLAAFASDPRKFPLGGGAWSAARIG